MWNLRCLMNLAVTAMFIKYAFGASHTVGAPGGGWDQTTNLNAWTRGGTFKVGDTLVFKYAAPHSVLEVSEADYKTCNGNNPMSSDTSGNTVMTLSSAGKRFFICGITIHCSQGMKLEVESVLSAPPSPSPPPPKTKTPSPPPPSPTTPSPPPPSATPPPPPFPTTPSPPSPVITSPPPPSPTPPPPTPTKSPPKATSPPSAPAKSPPKSTPAPVTPATPATPPNSLATSPSEAPASSPTQTTATGTNSNSGSGNRGHKEVKFAMVIGFGTTIFMSL